MSDSEPKKITFSELSLSEPVARAVAEHGYTEPTPVQAAAFGPACAGQDLVVQARTGTGKTAAFSLPLVSSRVRPDKLVVQALILCPTRELALQVTREVEALAKYADLRVASVYGGASITKQFEELEQGAHIVVGTPGRVLDHLKRKTLDVSGLRTFVLDECDEMLSMGFLPQITDIWSQLPKGHQTLLFSATVPKEVTRIAETRLKDPQFITLSGDHIGALEIQHFVYLSHGDRLGELLQIIEVENPESAIVFCNTRDETKRVAAYLKARGFSADWLNADLSQAEREQVMRATRESRLRFLVCTDVAARGIDISHLTHVVNFDFPDASEQYVHRTGRTGRAGKMGTAISLISPTEIGDLYYLRLKYKIQPQERHLPTRQELETRQQADVVASLLLRFGGATAKDTYYQTARRLLASDSAETIIAGLLRHVLGAEEQAIDAAAQQRRERKPRGDAPTARPVGTATRLKDGAERSKSSASDTTTRPSVRRSGEGPRVRSRHGRGEAGFRYEVSDAPTVDVDVPPADPQPADGAAPAEVAPSSRTSAERSSADGAADERDVAPTSGYVNLYVGVGKRDGANAKDLQLALEEAGVAANERGRILVKQRHSYVEVKPEVQQAVIDKLNGTSICGREALVEAARPRD